jgi:hypothetical protein
MAASKYLAIYLNDHLAGSTSGIELVRRARKANEQTPLGEALLRLEREIDADRETLKRIMRDLGVRPNPAKVAAGWTGEKLGRLKPNGHLRGYSPMSRVVELEGLVMGITGKLEGWRALAIVAESEPRLDRELLDHLVERAERQREEVEEHRAAAAGAAFVT